MKISRRVAWLLLLSGISLFLGLLFRAFIVAHVVIPIAMLLLMLWRLLLSVHQAIYWGLAIGLAMLLAFYRLAQVAGHEENQPAPSPDSVLKVVENWRLWLQLASDEGPSAARLKRELRYKLVSMYTIKQPKASPFTIREALRARQLPLPEATYRLLIGDEEQEIKLSWKERLQQLADSPGKRLRHWIGRDKEDYYQAVEETLTFMEDYMEIQHGDAYFDPSNH